MLTFFRKIRRSLIDSGNSSKYLLYAIGEIALVVVGILIALQINNWNEHRKSLAIEASLLNLLKSEFQINLTLIQDLLDQSDVSLKNARQLIAVTGPKRPVISEERFSDYFLSATVAEQKFRPSTGVLRDIISSGKLDVFRSEEVRIKLASWESHLERVRFQEDEEHGEMRSQLIDFVSEMGSWRKIIVDTRSNTFDFKQTRFPISNANLLQSSKFENLLVGFLATGQFLNQGYYKPLEKEIEEIISLIQSELEH